MSYGFEIKNRFGEDVLSTQGMFFVRPGYPQSMTYPAYTNNAARDSYVLKVLEPYGTVGGETTTMVTAHAPAQIGPTINDTTGFTWTSSSFGDQGLITQVTSNLTTSQSFNVNGSIFTLRMPHAVPGTEDGSDFIFFELPSTGLHYFEQFYQPYDNAFNINSKGLMGLAVPSTGIGSGNFLKYIVTTTQKPSVSGTHGLQTLDSSGNVIYDSRYLEQPFRVREVVKITKAQFEDCVNNGTTYTFPLRNNFATPYVGGSFPTAGRLSGSGTVQYPTISMLNSNTLQMTRQQYRTISQYTSTPSISSRARDGYIIMTDLGI